MESQLEVLEVIETPPPPPQKKYHVQLTHASIKGDLFSPSPPTVKNF